jgi:phage head maturation protease
MSDSEFGRVVEIRSASMPVLGVQQRIITVVAVPYEQPAVVEYRGQLWNELFSRSAFDGIEKRPQRVRVNREHVYGDTVGKVIAFYPDRDEGLVAEVKIAATPRGDDTLALAADDCLSSSIGYTVRPSDQLLDRRVMQRRINKAWLDHLALVESPAYAGADVLDVRVLDRRAASRQPLPTPVLDDFLTDPVIRKALGLESLSN